MFKTSLICIVQFFTKAHMKVCSFIVSNINILLLRILVRLFIYKLNMFQTAIDKIPKKQTIANPIKWCDTNVPGLYHFQIFYFNQIYSFVDFQTL